MRCLHRLMSRTGAGASTQTTPRRRRALHALPRMYRGLPEGRHQMRVHPIEAESYRIMAGRVDLSYLDAGCRAVVERVIHASSDLEYVDTMRFDNGAVEAAVDALAAGAPVVTDVEMARAGVPGAVCHLTATAGDAPTRAAAGMREAARLHPHGAVVVVGCAPTALLAAVNLDWDPA